MEVKTNSARQTEKIAEEFAKNLHPGTIVCMFGNLGAGKTVFFKGLAKGFGIKKRITSPTFVFLKIYKKGDLIINHIDLYRSKHVSDLSEIGLEEIFEGKAITVIEWADRLGNNLPKKRIDIFLETIDENKRGIRVVRH